MVQLRYRLVINNIYKSKQGIYVVFMMHKFRSMRFQKSSYTRDALLRNAGMLERREKLAGKENQRPSML